MRERTLELQDARDAARAANAAKSTFLATMSHELRTPLTAVLGYTELIAEEADDLGVLDDLRDDLGCLHTSATQLLALVGDVLDLAKVEAGELAVHPDVVALQPLLQKVAHLVEPLARERETVVAVQVDDDALAVWADPLRLEQCVLNLASNAAKHTDRGEVRIRGSLAPGGRVQIRVEDSGAGIAPEDHERVFEAYRQTREEAYSRRGTGLGLPLTRELMGLMGGTVVLERSAPGAGSVFALDLPATGDDGQ
ncbi:MAG: hypothetical protein H6736_03880 [Alphaproteobacteria bacterium]|nr:hypothetical protein [Alphaproteobacteria bacterium]